MKCGDRASARGATVKQLIAAAIPILTACIVTAIGIAQVSSIEPPVKDGRVTSPFLALAVPVDGKPDLIRIYLSGGGDEKSRVTAGLTVGKGDQLKVSAPLAVYEQSRVNPSPRKDWSIEVRLTRELAEDAEISLYLNQVDAPSDSGSAFTVRVARLLSAPTSQPAEAK